MVSFSSSQRVAVLYSNELNQSGEIEQLVKLLRKEGKEVSTMAFCDEKKGELNLPYFNANDISLTGDIHKSELSFFIDQKYDFAIYLDESMSYLLDYLYSLLDAKCRVGNYTLKRTEMFELMILCNKQGVKLGDEVLRYLKQISL
ncbi:MAG: hypothetical protein ACJA2C_002226 [Marinoscillum sp.]|jgi:hypothetical protein